MLVWVKWALVAVTVGALLWALFSYESLMPYFLPVEREVCSAPILPPPPCSSGVPMFAVSPAIVQTAYASMSLSGNTGSGTARMCIVGPHANDWDHLSLLLRNASASFAFVRYGDGERMLIQGQGVGKGTQAYGADKFWHEGGQTAIGDDMKWSLTGHYGQPYYYGFASPQDDPGGLKWFLQITEQSCPYITYANLWVNAFYTKTKALLDSLLRTELHRIVLIANYEGIRRCLSTQRPPPEFRSMELPDDAAHVWQGHYRDRLIANATALARSSQNCLFLVSGGPMAKALIAFMWNANPRNQYVDFGSSLDQILKGRITRPYMDPTSFYAKQIDPAWYVHPSGDARSLPL